MKRVLPIVLAAGFGTLPLAPLAAQIAPDITIAPGNTVLSVSGQGESLSEPDMAVFSAGVTTQGQTASAALQENSRAMEQVVAALERAGIAARDIQTSNLSVSPVYRDPQREAAMAARMGGPYVPPPPEDMLPVIVAYRANNTISVRQRELGDYGAIIDALASAGANQIDGPSFQMERPEPALDEARRAAVADARRKAELYAAAAGLRIVRVLSIAEGGNYSRPQYRTFGESMAIAPPPPPPAPPPPFSPGEMQTSATVSVTYELSR